MKQTNYIFGLLLIAFFIGCKSTPSDRTVLKGNISNGTDQYIYFQNFQGDGPLDSALIDAQGNFSLTAPNMKLDFYRLFLDKNNFLVLITDSTENPSISADADDLVNSYSISGSAHSQLLREFFMQSQSFTNLKDSLTATIQNLSPEDQANRDILIQKYNQSRDDFAAFARDFVNKNSSSPAALSAITVLDASSDLALMKKVSADLGPIIPGSVYIRDLNGQIASIEQQEAAKKEQEKLASLLQPGTAAPELELNDPNGNPIKLSQFRDKYVLIDFWASWCGPCRKENPNVVAAYNKYKKSGFEIYGVSLDRDKSKWVQAIEKDGLDWVHVSDLGHWNSIAAKIYGVRSIPFTVLLDKQGNVIATKLRGISLDNKLKEIFGY